MTTYDERAAAGAALLDAQMPNWEERIDLATLDMASWCRCIGGQLYGSYDRFSEALTLTERPELSAFNPDMRDLENEPLTDAWRRLIAERRFQRGAIKAELLAV